MKITIKKLLIDRFVFIFIFTTIIRYTLSFYFGCTLWLVNIFGKNDFGNMFLNQLKNNKIHLP